MDLLLELLLVPLLPLLLYVPYHAHMGGGARPPSRPLYSPLSETRVEGEPGLGCVVSGRPAGRSAGRPAGRPGGARVVSGAEKKII